MKKNKVIAVVLMSVLSLSACKSETLTGIVDSQGNAVAANPEQQSEFEKAVSKTEDVINQTDQFGNTVPESVDIADFYGDMDLAGNWKADGYTAVGTSTGDGWYSFTITRESDGTTWMFEGVYDPDMGALQYEGICKIGQEEISCGGVLSKNGDALNWHDSMLSGSEGVLLKRQK